MKIEEFAAIVVGPDQVLVIRADDDWDEETFAQLETEVRRFGLGGRVLVVQGAQIAVVGRDE